MGGGNNYCLIDVDSFIPIESALLFLPQQIGFVWNVRSSAWDANFDELVKYYTANGTFEVPLKDNRKLAQFVSRMRTAKHNEEMGLIQQECEFLSFMMRWCSLVHRRSLMKLYANLHYVTTTMPHQLRMAGSE